MDKPIDCNIPNSPASALRLTDSCHDGEHCTISGSLLCADCYQDYKYCVLRHPCFNYLPHRLSFMEYIIALLVSYGYWGMLVTAFIAGSP